MHPAHRANKKEMSQLQWSSMDQAGLLSKPCSDVKWNADGTLASTVCSDRTTKVHQLSSSAAALKTIRSVNCQNNTHARQVVWHPTDPSSFVTFGDDKVPFYCTR